MKLNENVILLDCEFNQLENPDIKSVDDWDKMMMAADYIFLYKEDTAKEFSDLYLYYEKAFNSPFQKPGVYMWDNTYEEWIHVWDKIGQLRKVIHRVVQVFNQQNENIPMKNAKEGE